MNIVTPQSWISFCIVNPRSMSCELTHFLQLPSGYLLQSQISGPVELLYLLKYLINSKQNICPKKGNFSELYQFSSVTQSCLTLCNPLDRSTPGLPVITKSRSLLKLIFVESVIPSYHLFLCRPLLILLSIFSSIRVFSNESVLHIRWPGVSASASVFPMNTQD